VGNQRLKAIIGEQRKQLEETEKFLDMLFNDYDLSKLFRSDLAKARCNICSVKYDCSVVDDPNDCLRAFGDKAAKASN
jgi:hypothetical protein